MFRRREKQSFPTRAREMVWPSAGWARWWAYTKHRIGRMQGTPHAIAAGFAFGAAVSFTPFLPFHIIIGVVLAYLFRVSVVAAILGTVMGNPWTFPFIWVGIYKLGIWVMGMEAVNFAAESIGLGYLLDHFWDVFLPMAVGGALTAIVAWVAFYFPVRSAVNRYQIGRQNRRERKKGPERAGASLSEAGGVGTTAEEGVS